MQRLNVEYIRSDNRGILTQINTDNWKQLNYLEILKENKFGGHYHKHKKELFYVVKGEVSIQTIDKTGGKNILLKKDEGVIIEPYDIHTIYAIDDSSIIEVLSEPYNQNDIWTE